MKNMNQTVINPSPNKQRIKLNWLQKKSNGNEYVSHEIQEVRENYRQNPLHAHTDFPLLFSTAS